LGLIETYALTALRFPKPKTKRPQIWPPPRSNKGSDTPLHDVHLGARMGHINNTHTHTPRTGQRRTQDLKMGVS